MLEGAKVLLESSVPVVHGGDSRQAGSMNDRAMFIHRTHGQAELAKGKFKPPEDRTWEEFQGRFAKSVNRISNDGYEFMYFDGMQLVKQLPSDFTAKIGIEDNLGLRFVPRWRRRPL